MEFSEYLQLDRMAHWPRFLYHPVHSTSAEVTGTRHNQPLCEMADFTQ